MRLGRSGHETRKMEVWARDHTCTCTYMYTCVIFTKQAHLLHLALPRGGLDGTGVLPQLVLPVQSRDQLQSQMKVGVGGALGPGHAPQRALLHSSGQIPVNHAVQLSIFDLHKVLCGVNTPFTKHACFQVIS